jgi:hypothetical protein
MMGRQAVDQSQLFYLFNLEEHIPADHLLRRINPIVTRVLVDLRQKLVPFYSSIGRPSVDPELMIRMLIVGYCYGIRFERKLCSGIAGSAASNSMTRFLIIRRSRLIATAAFATATSSGRSSRRWLGRAWTQVSSRVRASQSMRASWKPTPAVITARFPTRSTGRRPSARRALSQSS